MAPKEVKAEDVKGFNFNGVSGENYGSTFAGGQWKSRHTGIFIKAVSKPADYLSDRLKEIDGINTKLDSEFREKYAKWLSQGVSPDEARRRTETYIQKLAEALMEEVDAIYPEDIQRTAANLAYTKSSLGKNGVDPAVASASSTRRGRK